jgi:hypothetical protein
MMPSEGRLVKMKRKYRLAFEPNDSGGFTFRPVTDGMFLEEDKLDTEIEGNNGDIKAKR